MAERLQPGATVLVSGTIHLFEVIALKRGLAARFDMSRSCVLHEQARRFVTLLANRCRLVTLSMSDSSLDSSAAGKNVNSHLIETGRFPEWIEKSFELLLALTLSVELAVMIGNVIIRAFFSTLANMIIWTADIATLALTSLAFIGGAVAYHKGEHASVHFVTDRLSERWKTLLASFGTWAIFGFAIVGILVAVPIIRTSLREVVPPDEVPRSWIYGIFTVGMVLLVIIAVKRLLRFSLRTGLISGVAAAAFLLIWYFAQGTTGPWSGLPAYLFGMAILIGLIGIGVPIGFVLPIVAILYLVSTDSARIDVIPIGMIHGISGFIMMTIPFFILAGFLMTEGGLAKPLADWVSSVIGHVRGGLLYVMVISMFIFSGISGAKVADLAAIGTIMRDMLKSQGYTEAESTAALCASTLMGETIPPSIALLVLASLSSLLSVGAFLIAGVMPAVFMAFVLMIFIFFRARVRQFPVGEKASWRERMRMTILALPALLVPVILAVGIAGGIATPTEVSSFAVIYAILVSLLIYHKIGVRDLAKIFAHAGVVAGMILFIVSVGGAFSRTLTIAAVPHLVIESLNAVGGSRVFFLIATLIVLIVMGGLLEGLPALLIFGPMLLPVAAQFGIHPTHYGIVLIFAMGLGSFLPPLGVCFYVALTIGQSTMEDVVPRYLPYLCVILAGLILITFSPWISLWLPMKFHMIR